MTEKQTDGSEKFADPICGMSVAPETAAGKYDYKGETFYFCSVRCLNKLHYQGFCFILKLIVKMILLCVGFNVIVQQMNMKFACPENDLC